MHARRRGLSALQICLVFCVAMAVGCAGGRRLSTITPTSGDRFFVSGYHPYWAGDAWQTYPWEALDELYFFELEAGADGTIADAHGWPTEWLALVERSRIEGVRIVPTISQHDPAAFRELFADPELVARLIEQLTSLMSSTPGLGGLHLDFEVFEPVGADAWSGFTAFVAGLDDRLDALDPSLLLSTFALAFDDEDAYDEQALANVTDFLVVQGYDFHSRAEARAGPVAAVSGWGRLNWRTVLDRYLELGVPARKIVMAVPLYGYQWPATSDDPGAATRGPAIEIALPPPHPPPDIVPEMPRAFVEAARHRARRDPLSGSPYYAFQDAGGWYQGWFEDAESLRAKYAFVRENGLGGVALFPLAYGDEPLWSDLIDAFSRRRESPGG